MKKYLILTLLMMLLPLGSRAQRMDIIETRDGNKYEGYLARQVPNKSITIVSSKTTMTVAQRDAEILNRREVMIGDLSEECIALFPLLPDEAYVERADIAVEDWDGRKIVYQKALILEKGEYLKFVSFEPQAFELDWSQLKISSKAPYDFTKTTGLRDHLILPDARILEGQLMEQNLRSGILKFREKDGRITSFHKSAVQAIRFEPADPEADIWEQIPFCDKLNLKDGSVLEGFITSKLFGKTVELLRYNSDLTETVQVKDIESYEKYRNPLFKQKYDTPGFIERYADLYVNGESRSVCALMREKNSFSVMNEVDSLKVKVHAGERVVIKYRAEARTSRFRVARARLSKEKVYGLSGLKVKNKGLEQHPYFSKSDVLDDPDINFQSNDGNFIVADFVLNPPGAYVFYIDDSDRCFVIYAQ